MNGFSVTIIMPCLNEEKNLERAALSALESLDRLEIEGEVIIVNDGSTDETAAIASRLEARHKRIRVFHHPRPRGIGAAFWTGVQNANKEWATMIPGDNENDASQILRYAGLASEVDIIVPFVCNAAVRSGLRRWASSMYRGIVNATFGMSLNYTNGTVLYRTSILRENPLHSRGFFYQAELLVRLIRKGYLFAEVPCFLSERSAGKTKAFSLKSMASLIKDYAWLTCHSPFGKKDRNAHAQAGSATSKKTAELTRGDQK